MCALFRPLPRWINSDIKSVSPSNSFLQPVSNPRRRDPHVMCYFKCWSGISDISIWHRVIWHLFVGTCCEREEGRWLIPTNVMEGAGSCCTVSIVNNSALGFCMKEGDNKSNEAICHNTDLSWNSVSDTGIFICELSAEMNGVTD